MDRDSLKLPPALVLIAVGLVAGCAASQSAVPARQAPPVPRNAAILELGGQEVPSRLDVEVRDVRVIQGRAIRIRGRVKNGYQGEVDGVALRLRLLSTDGRRVLSTEFEELALSIAPASTEAFELEIESVYFPTVPQFLIKLTRKA